MPDINPYDQAQQQTPARQTATEVLAETRRVLTAALRANPLRNAVVDDGLMRWRGKYGGDFLWLGEIGPADPTDGELQRGFVLRRDDPQKQVALSLYDFDPAPAGPLRQRLLSRDVHGRAMMVEGEDGGMAWPYTPFSVFADSMFSDDGAPRIKPLAVGVNNWRPMWKMIAPLTGPLIRVNPFIQSGGSPPIAYDLRLEAFVWTGTAWEQGISPLQSGSGGTQFSFSWDLLEAGLWRAVTTYVEVSVMMRFTTIPGWVTASDTVWGYCRGAFVRGNGSTADVEPPTPPE